MNDYKKTSDITLVDEVGFYYTSPVATGRYGMEEIDLEIISISPSPERERGRYTSHVVFYKKKSLFPSPCGLRHSRGNIDINKHN